MTDDIEKVKAHLEIMYQDIGDPDLRKAIVSAHLAKLTQETKQKIEKAQKPEIKELTTATKSVQLDFWDDGKRAAPNAVFRSALFPVMNPKQKENRPFVKAKELGSVSGVTVIFTGEQFDQSDLDVYLELLNLVKPLPTGTSVKFSAHSLLKVLGLTTGGENHKRLHSVLIRLCGGVVDMTDHKKRYFGQLLHGGIREELTHDYEITLNPKFVGFFNGMWSSLDKEQRQALGRKTTAKALHCYYSSHVNPTAHKFETLAEIIGLNNSNKRQLKADLIKAHEELKIRGFLSDYEVTGETIKVIINHSPSQIRHIVKKARNSRSKK